MATERSAVILGAGVAGLAAGWRLARTGWRVTVIERAPVIGGLCASFRHGDMTLDHGPHKCFSVIPEVMEELRRLMGDELLTHEKRQSIYLFGRYLRYPLRMTELMRNMGAEQLARCGVSAVTSRIRALTGVNGADSYENYVVSRFGRHLYRLVFEPLADKVWGDPETLSADIARTRIPSASVAEVVARLLKLRQETAMTDALFFHYPHQGFGRIPERMAEEIVHHGGTILTATTPVAVAHEGPTIRGVTVEADGQTSYLPCDLLISTIPFDALGILLQQHRAEPELSSLLEAARTLQYRHLILAYVVVEAEQLTEDHWIFFPERSVAFGRIFEQKRLSRSMVPPDKTVICCDMVDGEHGDRWRADDRELAERCVADLRSCGILGDSEVKETFVKRVRRFYPRYDLNYRETLTQLYGSLQRYENLLSTGRIGFYNYNNSDHCLDMAMQIEQGLAEGQPAPEIMRRLERRVTTYRIVD